MKCARCNGTGVEPDNKAIGKAMRHKRNKARLTLRRLEELSGLGHSFISQLERGERRWTRKHVETLENAILAQIF